MRNFILYTHHQIFVRWTGHVARVGTGVVHTGVRRVNLREGDHLKDLGIDGRIILKMDLRQMGWGHGLDRFGSGQGKVADCCECGYELFGSIKCGEFLQ
jgi:hypothetical protein